MVMQLYVSFVRRRQKKPNYKAWDRYSWDDYLSRHVLSKTFYARHVPQRGTFGDLLPDPTWWNNSGAEAAAATASQPQRNGLTSVMDSINNAAVTAQKEWDSDKEEFI